MGVMGWLRTVALAGGLVGLTGCAMFDAMKADLERAFPGSEAVQKPSQRELDTPPAATSPMATSPAVTPPASASPSEQAREAERGSSLAPDPKPLSPRQLVGMTQDEARRLLGNPSAQHSDPPATVWTWRNSKCEIDVFFYMDLSDRNFRALTYEVRGPEQRASKCLGELREESRRGRGPAR